MKKVLFAVFTSAAFAAAAYAQSLSETFTYPDGPLVGAAGSPWVHASGVTTGEQNIVTGRLFLNDSETEDTAAPLSSTATSGSITASFELTMDPLDNATSVNGDYITHFVATDGTLIGRVFTRENLGGPADSFQLGISTTSETPVFFSVSFTTGVTYLMFLTYDFTLNTASLFETAHGSVTSTVAVDNNSINRYGFRQTASTGDQFIDNLVVIPEPATSLLLGVGLLLGAQRLRRKRS